MDQNKMPLADALNEYRKSNRISMHIPGHKECCGDNLTELESIMGKDAVKCDITEIEGFDDYHEPEGIIKEAEMLAADLFGSDETHFLINGTTAGIMAAVASVAFEGERIAVSRDSHKSVIRGLIVSGAEPVFIDPFIDDETGLPCGISCSELENIMSYGGIKAVVLSNPSYYGTYSDLRAVVDTAHRYGAAVIVDEAHGAHLKFASQPYLPDAMSAGADISVQSTHKMLGSLTQSSMLHVQGERIDRKRLFFNVRLFSSTSPSYLLMASLDAVRHCMALSGNAIWKKIIEMTEEYADRISEIRGITCVREFRGADGRIKKTDSGRLLISALECGLDGYSLSHMLYEKYNIDTELADDRYVLAVMGSGTTERQLAALLAALRKISDDSIHESLSCNTMFMAAIDHEYAMSPRNAVFSRHDLIEADYAAGRVSAEEIAVYPPGIPFVVPGERITREAVDLIKDLAKRGVHIHGIEHRLEDGIEKIMLTVAEDENQSMLFECIF
jgi:arginine/lysine/ornithine decarboxylase